MKIVILDWKTMTWNNELSSDVFKKFGDVECYDFTSPELAAGRIGDSEIVLCNKVQITREIIDKCPNMKYIGLFATGYNNIDIEYASEKNIMVCNAGEYSTMAVAQHTFAMILEVYSKISIYNNAVKNGEWISSPAFSYFPYETSELYNKTLGIVGYGSIGRAVAKIAGAFGMNVMINTRTYPKNCPYKVCSLEECAENADIITFHCPLTEKTKGIINNSLISHMKKTALIVNTSRGAVVNENELAEALNCKRIAGACLDVLDKEPMNPDNPLRYAENCIITPHSAWSALETRKRLLDIVFENLDSYLHGNPVNRVN
ncbi:MAG: D-2-hydroxyacid dehydrogenase [Oscillospiraceae bacterium]|nr:D-2-hydroxyacid dehydrogenase [Oscillospiraceae bacterium]